MAGSELSRRDRRIRLAGASALVAAAFGLSIADLAQHYESSSPTILMIAVARAFAVALCWRRPSAAFVLSLAVALVTALSITPSDALEPWLWPISGVLGHAVVLSVASLRQRGPSVVIGARVGAAWIASLAAGAAALPFVAGGGPDNLVAPAIGFAGALALGVSLGARSEAEVRLHRQHELTAAERAERSRLQERSRLARELHDVVAHHLSVVVVRADSAPHRVEEVSEAARAEFAGIADEARSSLEEMRRVLRLLREEDAEFGSGLGDLLELVESVRAAGASVDLVVSDIDLTDRSLAPAVDLTAYRVVQEALSNAIRHAPGAPVAVDVRAAGRRVSITVTNPLDEGERSIPTGPGHGLAGMRERVELVSGGISTGPQASKFVVDVWLPIGEAA